MVIWQMMQKWMCFS